MAPKRGYGDAIERYLASGMRNRNVRMRVASHIWANRGTYSRAARTIGRAARSYIKRKNARKRNPYLTRPKGRRSPVMASKVPAATISRFFIFGTKFGFEGLQTKRMYPALLPMVKEPGPSADDDLHTASKLQYLLKGFKICAIFENTIQSHDIEVNMMIFQLKDTDPKSVSFPNPGDIGKDFFVNSDNAVQERHVNFQNRTTYTLSDGTIIPADPGWNAEQNCMRVNKDKFNVIYFKKWRMTRPGSPQSTRVNYCKVDRYFKVNKRMAYEKPGDPAVRQPIRVMIWYDTLMDRGEGIGVGSTTDSLRVNMNCVGYTKDL